MSRRGHSPDNAACEAFFGRLKSFGAEGYDTIDGRRARLGLAA